MLSLKTKIIASLISMSVLAIAIGGVSAQYLMLKHFEKVIYARVTFDFSKQVLAYYNAYGSWEAATEVETFFQYTDKQLALTGGPPGARQSRGTGERPTGPNARAREQAIQEGRAPAQVTELPTFGGRPPPFNVTDLEGKVWIAPPNSGEGIPGRSTMGSTLPDNLMKNAVPLMNGDTQIGYVLSSERAELTTIETETLSALKKSWIYTLLLVLAVVTPIGFILGLRLIAPINNLSTAMKSMQPGNMQQEVPVTSNDEIGKMSENFNRMNSNISTFIDVIQSQKDKIIETEKLRKEGIASISHELMTPLNSTVAQVNAMADGIRPSDQEQVGKLSNSLTHLTKLVDDLFQLSLADVNALECRSEKIDFSMLITDAVEFKTPALTNKQFRITTRLPEQLEVLGDATRLRQIIDNLLENTVKYADQGGEVKIALESEGNSAILTVSDSGPGVSIDKLDMLFERFFREEASRNRDTGGSGLGLSLVKAWAEAQQGAVSAFISAEGGLGIRVSVPTA